METEESGSAEIADELARRCRVTQPHEVDGEFLRNLATGFDGLGSIIEQLDEQRKLRKRENEALQKQLELIFDELGLEWPPNPDELQEDYM